MAVPPSTWRTRTAFRWLTLSALAIVVLAPLPYVLVPLAELASNGTEVAADYVDRSPGRQLTLLLHAGAGGLALLLSPLQFAARLRHRAPAVHLAVGRVLLGSIAAGVPEQVAFTRARLLVTLPRLGDRPARRRAVPGFRYPAACTRFPAVRRGT